jgi:hypothetical protein
MLNQPIIVGFFVLGCVALATGCSATIPTPKHVPSESFRLAKINCRASPGALDTDLVKHEGFMLTADKSLLVWSGPEERTDGLQTVTGTVRVTFRGPDQIRFSGEEKVFGGYGLTPHGDRLELDLGTVPGTSGEWNFHLSLYTGEGQFSTLTITRKIMSGKIPGTENYLSSAVCKEELESSIH